MKQRIIAAMLAVVSVAVIHAPELLTVDDGKTGINATPKERYRWRQQGLEATKFGTIDPSWYRSLENLDFFTLEYGKPCEAMDFSVPEKKTSVWSRTWGYVPNVDVAGIRFGRGWENYCRCKWSVEMDVEQDAEETAWQIRTCTAKDQRQDYKFNVKGRGRQTVCRELGLIRALVLSSEVSGLELDCLTPGAKGRIHSLRLVPRVATMTWKRVFDLDEKPVRVGLSMTGYANYLLKVNGETAGRGAVIQITRIDRHELAKYVKRGRNEITIAAEVGGGFEPGPRMNVEFFVVNRDGRTVRFEADENWLWSRDGKDWKPARRVRREISDVPLHAGALDPRPVERNGYPVFDCDADIAWRFSLPGGIMKPRLEWKVTDALKGGTVETGFCDTGLNAAKDAPTVEKTVRLKTRRTGAYRVWWKLLSDGKTIDEHDTEMIVAGPLEQTVVPLKDFERTLVSRMKKIQEVDCTKDDADPTRFLDHTRKWAKPQLNVGKVAETGGVRARQTGPGNQDYFAYKLDVEHLGMPHILEVDYPETHEYTLYCWIAESYPIGFVNNPAPAGARSFANATGSVKVGGYLPLSGKVRTMRIVFFPSSKSITAAFENGGVAGPAAVCAFRLYEVPEGLPALDIPKDTPRRYMNHNERQFYSPWGGYLNPVIKHERCGLVEDGWIAAYAAAANKTAFLRYAGHNASDEGVYMYNTGFPTRSGESLSMNPEFDFRYPLLKLYRHNGIHTVLTFEYVRSPSLQRLGETSVSDREVQAGTKRTIYNVLRDGRQAVAYSGSGVNFMNPQVRASMRRILGEIHDRYAAVSDVENLLVVVGSWWMPGMTRMSARYGYEELGYNDENIEAFERETGVALGTGTTGVERFARRHELLNGPHRRAWCDWRVKKMQEAVSEVRSVVRKGDRKWELLLMPCPGPTEASEEFSGYRVADFGEGTGNPVRLLADMTFGRECDLESYGKMFCPTSLENIWRQDCAKFGCGPLNEHWHSAAAAKTWWWRESTSCVFDVKPSGDCAFWDTVTTCASYAPQMIIHTWLDMNCTTAHAEACRRFLDAYYRLPLDRHPKTVASVCGINAKRYGDKVLLVNPTPWAVEGVFGAGEKMRLGPYGMAVRDAAGAKGEFRMAEGCPHPDFAAAVKAMTYESLKSGAK